MGGTDGLGQQLTYCKPRIESRRWSLRVFFYFFEVIAYNSYVLYRQDMEPKMKFLQYTEIIFNEMTVPCLKSIVRKVCTEKAAKIAKNESRYTDFHESFFYHRHGGETDNNMRCCSVCHSRVSTGCIDCDVALCLRDSDSTTSFLKKFHDKSNA